MGGTTRDVDAGAKASPHRGELPNPPEYAAHSPPMLESPGCVSDAAFFVANAEGVCSKDDVEAESSTPELRQSSTAWRPVRQRPTQERRHLPSGDGIVRAETVVGGRASGDASTHQEVDAAGEDAVGWAPETRVPFRISRHCRSANAPGNRGGWVRWAEAPKGGRRYRPSSRESSSG